MYIDDGGGGKAQSEAGWDSIGASMTAFANMAASGGFEVNESGGEALLTAIRRMRKWASDQQFTLRDLTQPMPLGTSHAAQVMIPYVQQVATDHEGFLTRLSQLQQVLQQAEEAIITAMANYKATDEAKQSAFGNIEPA